jgi:hypothetical protein
MKNKGVMVKLALAGLVALSLFVVAAIPAYALPVTTVSIGDVSLQQGDSTTIPIMITKDTAQAVSSAQINLTYDSSVVQVTAVGGSEFDNFYYNIVDGKVRMVGYPSGASLTTPIKFAGVTIKAIGKPGCTPLNLEIVGLTMATGSQIYPREVSNGLLCITVPVPEYNIFGLSALVGLLAIILGISIRAKRK